MPEGTEDRSGLAAVRVDRLHLAAWLRLNKQRLISREWLPDGRFAYYFEPSSISASLIEKWSEGAAEIQRLSSFARIVSSEIRTAVTQRRRSAG